MTETHQSRYLLTYTKSLLVEEIVQVYGLCGKQRRRDLESLSIDQLTAIRDEILREALIL